MTAPFTTSQATSLRRAAVRATLAPSIHNSQPWKLRVRHHEMLLYADRSRQLHVVDPTGRQLMISCGCAVLNARVALAASGLSARVGRLPDIGMPELLARIEISPDDPVDEGLAALDHVIESRQTSRRRFADDPVPADLLDVLERAAGMEGADLVAVRGADQRAALAALSQRADDIENLDPAYRAELRAWMTADSDRRDGVPASVVPHVDGSSGDEIPIRDFDTLGAGRLPSQTRSGTDQCLVLLCTAGDAPADWLRAGEALERVLLETTRHGYAAGLFTQVTEVPSTRARLRGDFGLQAYPHVLLRIGRAPRTPSTHRRRLVDVLVDET